MKEKVCCIKCKKAFGKKCSLYWHLYREPHNLTQRQIHDYAKAYQ